MIALFDDANMIGRQICNNQLKVQISNDFPIF